MSKTSRGINNIKHKSSEDKKAASFAGAVEKVGAQEEADELLVHWGNHKRSETLSERKKRESDGFLRGVILSQNLSRAEAMTFFKIGRYRFDRLRDLNPNLPVPKKRPNDNVLTTEDKEFIRVFMKAMETEPGYPCHHRSTPVYMADPDVTFVSLHNLYKQECQDRDIRILSYDSFRSVVKFLMPTIHLGKTRADSCNACFSLNLQIKDPETSEELRQELKAAKQIHLKDAIVTRRAISKLVKSVQMKVAPDDPPLIENPVFIPTCFKDPYDRLNRPLVENYEEGLVGAYDEDDGTDENNFDSDLNDDNEEGTNDEPGEKNPRALRVSVQDFGSGIPLPSYGADQPNHDYFASNITLHNMNFVDCETGLCHISYFDERQAGKDGNSVSSLRWNNLKHSILGNQDNIPVAECKVLDNCVGQNKSNTTHKFSMLCSLLIFPEGVTDIYFKVGHSHNQSDQKTGHAAKAISKKNLYTPQAIAKEVNKVKGLFAEVLDERSDVFQDWKRFLDKHFPNMDPGFTSFYIFQFKNGVVEYKELNEEGDEVTIKSKVFCSNPEAVKRVIIRELFNLSSTSSVVEICKAKPRLPPLPKKRISQKKIDSMKTLYQQIPRQCRWFYPEGDTVLDEPFAGLRRAAALHAQDLDTVHVQDEGVTEHDVGLPALGPVQDGGDGRAVVEQFSRQGYHSNQSESTEGLDGKRSVGRPKKVQSSSSGQPAIHRFFIPISDQNPSVSGSSKGKAGATTSIRMETRDLIDDKSDESVEECSDEERVTSQVLKKRKVLDDIFSDYDSDDEFNVVVDNEAGTSSNSTERERVAGTDEVTGASVKDGAANSTNVSDDGYSVDVNHNSGRIVLKILKK